MKTKEIEKKTFSFHSISSPCDFISRVKEEAVKSNYKVWQTENGFNL